jgi:hypothetical protein
MIKKILKILKNPIIITPLTLALIVVFGIIYLTTIPYSKIPQFIENEMNNGLSFTRDGGVPIDGIKGYTLGRDYKIVQTKFDFTKPVYSMIVSYSNDDKKEGYPIIQTRVIYLERQNLQDFKVTKYLDNQVNGLKYQEVIDLATKYDLTTNFPGKENYKITNYPPLTQTQIESNKALNETDKVLKEGFLASKYYLDKQQAKLDVENNPNSTKEQKVEAVNKLIDLQKPVLESLKNGNDFKYPDGAVIKASQENITLLEKQLTGLKVDALYYGK